MIARFSPPAFVFIVAAARSCLFACLCIAAIFASSSVRAEVCDKEAPGWSIGNPPVALSQSPLGKAQSDRARGNASLVPLVFAAFVLLAAVAAFVCASPPGSKWRFLAMAYVAVFIFLLTIAFMLGVNEGNEKIIADAIREGCIRDDRAVRDWMYFAAALGVVALAYLAGQRRSAALEGA